MARRLERDWERCLSQLGQAREAVAARERIRRRTLGTADREAVLALGEDLPRVWQAATTTARDRKEVLRELLEEVMIDLPRERDRVRPVLRWRSGLRSETEFERQRGRPAPLRSSAAIRSSNASTVRSTCLVPTRTPARSSSRPLACSKLTRAAAAPVMRVTPGARSRGKKPLLQAGQ